MQPVKENNDIIVGIASYSVDNSPNRIVTLGLGSCVGICLYDPFLQLGGLLHVMLPDHTQFSSVSNPAKFADTGIQLMVEEIVRRGGKMLRLYAKLAGGAQMFSGLDKTSPMNVGKRNVEMTKSTLAKMGIKIAGEDVGGNQGRTIFFDLKTGQVIVRSMGNNYKVI